MEAPKRAIEPLDKRRHHREGFSCESAALERYLKTQASQDVQKKVAAVFVLVEGRVVIGYYTLSSYTIDPGDLTEEIAKRLPIYPKLPAILIGRLARDRKYARQGIGEILLIDALRRSFKNTSEVGATAVVVEAENEKARAFYVSYGFIPFPEHPNKLFLPMATIKRLFLE